MRRPAGGVKRGGGAAGARRGVGGEAFTFQLRYTRYSRNASRAAAGGRSPGVGRLVDGVVPLLLEEAAVRVRELELELALRPHADDVVARGGRRGEEGEERRKSTHGRRKICARAVGAVVADEKIEPAVLTSLARPHDGVQRSELRRRAARPPRCPSSRQQSAAPQPHPLIAAARRGARADAPPRRSRPQQQRRPPWQLSPSVLAVRGRAQSSPSWPARRTSAAGSGAGPRTAGSAARPRRRRRRSRNSRRSQRVRANSSTACSPRTRSSAT